MAVEYKNIVRKEFDTVAEATAVNAMINGQWAWTTVDKTLVIRDEVGAFALIPVPSFSQGKILTSVTDTFADFLENKLLANSGIEFVAEENPVSSGNFKVKLKAGYQVEIKNTSFVAIKNRYYLVDSSAGNITVTLPSGTATDTQIGIKHYLGGNVVSIVPYTGLIDGKAQQLLEMRRAEIEVKSDGTNYQIINDSRSADITEYMHSTGLCSGGVLSIPASPSSVFNISAGIGVFADTTTDPLKPDVEYIKFPAFENQVIPSSGSGQWFIYIKRDKTLLIENAQPTPQKRRENIYLGFAATPALNTSIVEILDFPVPAISVSAQFSDFLDIIEPAKSGLKLGSNGANLGVKIEAGQLSYRGGNWVNNTKSPNTLQIALQAPATLNRITRSSTSFGSDFTVLDVANYDVGGTVTAIGGVAGRCAIHRIFAVPTSSGLKFVQQYGQTAYTNIDDAVTALADGSDEESFIQNPAIAGSALFGVIIAIRTATNLSLSTEARFRSSNKLCELAGGGGATTAPIGDIQVESYSLGRYLSTSPGNNFGVGIAGVGDGTGDINIGFFPLRNNHSSTMTTFKCRGYLKSNATQTATVKAFFKTTNPAGNPVGTPGLGGTQIGATANIASPGNGTFTIDATGLTIPQGSYLWLEIAVTNNAAQCGVGATMLVTQ